MQLYYSCLGTAPVKHNYNGKDIHKKEFNRIPQFIKKYPHINFLHDDFKCTTLTQLFEKEVINIINGYVEVQLGTGRDGGSRVQHSSESQLNGGGQEGEWMHDMKGGG